MWCIDGACPICGTGTRGLRMCSDNARIVAMCDECDAVWLSPHGVGAKDAVFAAPPLFLLPGHDCSLATPSARWATRSEVETTEWADLVAGTAIDGD